MHLLLTALILLSPLVLLAQPVPHAVLPEVEALVEQMSVDSMRAIITRLSAFHTRHTFSDTTSDSIGVGAALRWTEGRAAAVSGGRFDLTRLHYTASWGGQPTGRYNLRLAADGVADAGARFIIGAHLDSRTVNGSDNTGFAPGADDNGSGCAALLELARILPDSLAHSLEIIWFTGEEQGLYGSEAYAQALRSQGARVDGMIALDMIGHILTPNGQTDSMTVRLYAAGATADGGTASPSRGFQRYLRWVGEAYVPGFLARLMPAADRPGRGSDHLPFSDEGYPAVRFIEQAEDLAYQHNPNDVIGNMSPAYARRVAVVAAAGLLTALQAPPRPPSPVAVQTGAGEIRITIPDSVVLPGGGRFYLSTRDFVHSDFDSIIDLGGAREYTYTGAQTFYAYTFAVSREDARGYPSPFSTETVVDVLPMSVSATPPLPGAFGLSAFPNPFNSTVRLGFTLPRAAPARLDVFDITGRRVATLVDRRLEAGEHRFAWSPTGLASGLYLARLLTDADQQIVKLALVR